MQIPIEADQQCKAFKTAQDPAAAEEAKSRLRATLDTMKIILEETL